MVLLSVKSDNETSSSYFFVRQLENIFDSKAGKGLVIWRFKISGRSLKRSHNWTIRFV